MYYDEVNVWCEEPAKVDCGERPVCDQNDQNCFTPTAPPTVPPSDFNCPQPDGYFPDPENCIYFYQCVGDMAYRQLCQEREYSKN